MRRIDNGEGKFVISRRLRQLRIRRYILLSGLFVAIIITAAVFYIFNRISTKASISPEGSLTSDFSSALEPTFVVNSAGMVKSNGQAKALGELDLAEGKISSSLKYNGEIIEQKPEISTVSEENDRFVVKVEKNNQFKPGKYQLEVDLSGESESQTLTQDFTWGVLALNPDQSIYKPGQLANLTLAVLDDQGKMVCDAKLELKIRSPELTIDDTLSTENGKIKVNPECQMRSYTEKADYQANYQVEGMGIYSMELRAETKNGLRQLEDRFLVEENSDFIIKREGPTRIYPPEKYKMKISAEAGLDFPGPVREYLPKSFEISPQEGLKVEENDKSKVLTWEKDFFAGEKTVFEYEFKAPDISPQFYLLGPLEIGPTVDPNGQPTQSDHIFTEPRQWQIAADTPVSEGDGILFYAASANTTPQWRTYTNSTNDFSANSDTVAGAQPAINQIKTSPTKQEAIAGYQDTSGNLRVLCYDGTSWSEDWTVAVAGAGTPTTRRFDIAYETNTGDVTVAYSRNTAAANALAYRYKLGSAGCGSANWQAAQNFPTTTTVTSATVMWVKAQRDGRSAQNLSAWVWLDNAATQADLGAAIWSGSAFTNFKSLETSMEHITAVGDTDNFDVQYESLSGDVMVVWGNSAGGSNVNGYRYNTCTGGTSSCTWLGPAATLSGPTDGAMMIDLSADPLSDKMAMAGICAASDDMSAGYWDGGSSGWTGYANVDNSTETTAQLPGMKLMTTGWLTNNGNTKWYISYDDSAGIGLSYKYAIDGGTITSPSDYNSTPDLNDLKGRYDTDMNPFNNAELIQTVSDKTNGIFAYKLSMDTSGNLSWSDMASAVSLGTKPNHPQQGFSYQYWRYIPPLVITVSSSGTQTSSMTIPSTNNYVGGAFTFIRNAGSANVTQIIITEQGTVNANANLSNVDIYYETAGTCTYDGTETLFGTASSFNASEKAAVSGTMAIGTSQVCVYAVLDVGSGAGNGQTLEIEISNPSTEVTVSSGTVTPGTAVAIAGTTTLSAPSNNPPNSPSNLVQKKVTGGATLATGDWTNETQVQFTATASDTDNPDTLYLCVEKDYIEAALSSTDGGDLCGSGVAYSGTPVTVSVTITGMTDAKEYHWQAQVKDAASAYSAFVGYGSNTENPPTNPAARDFGLDTTAPTGGTVYDGTSGDQDWNDGSLTSISGNWTGFDASVSGLNKYEYAIRRKPDDNYWSVCSGAGSWQAGANWCDNSTNISFSQNNLNLQTGVIYYVSVRATDNATNIGSPINSNGQQVSPTLSFSYDTNTITFADLNNTNSWTDTKTNTFTTSTNATSGYTIKGSISQLLTSLAYPTVTIADFVGSWISPQNWVNFCKDDSGDCGFGYTSNDTTIQGANKFLGGTLFAAFNHSSPGDIVADHTEVVNGQTGAVSGEQFTATYKVSVSSSQSASQYRTTAIYIVTANY